MRLHRRRAAACPVRSISIGRRAGSSWPELGGPLAVQPREAAARPYEVAARVPPSWVEAVRPYAALAGEQPCAAAVPGVRPSWVEATARPSSPAEAAPSWAVAPEQRGLPAAAEVLPPAPQGAAVLAAAQAEVSEPPQRRPALAAQPHWLAAHPLVVDLREPREPSRQWRASRR